MMKKTTLFRYGVAAALLLAISTQWYSAQSSAGGPGAGYANAPSDDNCGNSGCHGGGVTTSTGITISGITGNTYTPGKKYTIKLDASISQSIAGFQVTVLDSATNKWAGTLRSTSTSTRRDSSSTKKRVYVGHKTPQTAKSGKVSWTFDWFAPTKGTGTVIFHIVVNDADGNTKNSGDDIIGRKINIREEATPTAAFTMSSTSLCLGDTLFLKDASSNSPTKWQWTSQMGAISNDTLQHPYVTYTKAGTDTISLVATNKNGSSPILKKAVTIYDKPADTIAIVQGGSLKAATSATICPGDSIQLTASAGTTFKWSNGATTSAIYAKSSGAYSVTVTNAGGCSKLSKTFTLNHHTLPSAPSLMASDDSVCAGETVMYHVMGASAFNSFTFFKNGSSVQSGTGSSYIYAPAKGDVITVKGMDATCFSGFSSGVGVKVNAVPSKPSLATVPAGGIVCQGDSVNFQSSQDPTVAVYSFYKNGSVLASSASRNISFPSTGLSSTDSYFVKVETVSGCANTSGSLKLTISAKPVAGFTTNAGPQSVTFTNASTGSKSYSWNFGDNSSDTAANPVHAYAASGPYKVLLTVTNANGCTDTVSQLINFTLTALQGIEGVNNSLALYPNPVKERLTINLTAENASPAAFVIRNHMGQEVSRSESRLTSGHNQIEVSCEALPAGVYFLQVVGAEGYQVVKFLKQ